MDSTRGLGAAHFGLTRLALELGYFDLAHFTRHFRRAVGRSPTAFLRAGAAA